MEDILEILRRPVEPHERMARAANFLAEKDEFAYTAMSFGDLIYDRFNIDPAALQAFDFVHRPNAHDIHNLATWSAKMMGRSGLSFKGTIDHLQGYVFERLAAAFLRQTGAIVEFPESATQPGWDFLVNGVPYQAKCGNSPELVAEHLRKYPDIKHLIVNADIGSHFDGDPYITVIHGLTRDTVHQATVDSLGAAGDMVDLHLAHFLPFMSAIRNGVAAWRGVTDWRFVPANIAVEGAARGIGAGAGGLAAFAAVGVLGVVGWPAIILPHAAAAAGIFGGRKLADIAKQELLMRSEHASLTAALRDWCAGSAKVLWTMIASAARFGERIAAVRERAHPDYRAMFDDWQERLSLEQAFRRFHREKFIRGASDPRAFDDGHGPLSACVAAMIGASHAGVLPGDLVPEQRALTAAMEQYRVGLRRHLLAH